MRCNVCGADNLEGAAYCEDCGARLPMAAAQPTQEAPVAAAAPPASTPTRSGASASASAGAGSSPHARTEVVAPPIPAIPLHLRQRLPGSVGVPGVWCSKFAEVSPFNTWAPVSARAPPTVGAVAVTPPLVNYDAVPVVAPVVQLADRV